MSSTKTFRQAIRRLVPKLLAAGIPLMCLLQCNPLPHQTLASQQPTQLATLADANLETGLIAASEDSSGQSARSTAHPNLLLARSNPARLLEKALERWEPVEGYRVTFITQERLNGVLGAPSIIEATVMRQPCAVSFRWVKNPGKVDRLLWMPSRFDKLMVRPTGVISAVVKCLSVDPQSDSVQRASRRSVTTFGLANTIKTVLAAYRKDTSAGSASRAVMTQCGVNREPAICLERVTGDRASETHTLRIWLEAETLRPLMVQQYGWSNELLASYAFENFQQVQLSQQNFELAALDMR